MIGIVIVTHAHLGEALIEAARLIFDEIPESIVSVSIDLTHDADRLRNKIKDAISAVDQNSGVLILTDMFGGTPSNLGYSFLEEGRIEVLSGVNLPVVIRAINLRKRMPVLHDMAVVIEEYGKKSISLASGILKGNKRG